MSKHKNSPLRNRPQTPPGELVFQQTRISFSGPLPAPDALAKYNDILPGLANRLTTMAESQLSHRQVLEKKLLAANIRQSYLGQVLAFLLAAGVAGGGFYLIGLGKDGYGIAAIITAIGGLAGVFVLGRRSQERERAEKRRELEIAAGQRQA